MSLTKAHKDFEEGFNLFLDDYAPRMGDIGSITANQLSGSYLSGIASSVEELSRNVNSFQDNNNPQLFGLVLEAVGAGTFNVDAAAKQTGEYAWRVGSNQLGSVDIATSWGEDYGLKYYKSAYGSVHAQTRSIEQEYLSYIREYSKRHPDSQPPSTREYLISKGMDPSTDMSRPLYANQTLLCPPEQGPTILALISDKIKQLSEAGDTSGTLERYLNLRDNLAGQITSPNGAESLKITYDQAHDIAELAREGKFDPKDFGITVASKANQALIWRNAALSGLNAAWVAALLKSAPVIVDSIKYAIKEGYFSSDDIRNIGLTAGEGFSEGFLRGLIAAAVTTLAMEGKLGMSFQKLALSSNFSSIIGVVVVLLYQTAKDVLCYSRGDISKEELGYRIDKSLVITAFSVTGGIAGQLVLPFIPVVSYMLGSMVGSVLGGVLFNAKERFLLGLAVSQGYSFWGLVNQDYQMPKEMAERLGYSTFDYAEFDYAEFAYEKFDYATYEYAAFNYAKLEFYCPERGLIGVRKVGFIK